MCLLTHILLTVFENIHKCLKHMNLFMLYKIPKNSNARVIFNGQGLKGIVWYGHL